MFFFVKIFGLSGVFNPDLHQYWIKSGLFTSRHLDFSALSHCCVQFTLGKIRQLSDATQVCSWSPTSL